MLSPPIVSSTQLVAELSSSAIVVPFSSTLVSPAHNGSAETNALNAQTPAMRSERFILVAEMLVHLRAVDRFVAASRPAGALLDPARVIAIADENLAVAGLLLEMALEAKIGAALGEQFLVHRAVGRMAGNTSFADRLVFEDVGPSLGDVALQAGSVRPQHRDASPLHALRHIA